MHQQSTEVASYIPSPYKISQSTWVLSWIVSKDNATAFLVLEGLNKDGKHIAQKMYLQPKPNTNRRAEIKYELDVEFDTLHQRASLYKFCELSYDFVSKELIPLLTMHKEKGDYDEIIYSKAGKTAPTTFFAGSIEKTGVHASNDSLENSRSTPASIHHSMQYLMAIGGYNSSSWVEAFIQAVGLKNKFSELAWQEYNIKQEGDNHSKGNCCTM